MEIEEKNLARLTGLFYLLVIICAGFSQGYVRGTLVIADDAHATAQNIMNNVGLFRLGLTSDLLAFIFDTVISVLLYQLLKPAGKTLALISSAFRLIAHPAIASLNLLNHYLALEVISVENYSLLFDGKQETFMMLFLDAHNYGYLLAGAFFGVHCILLGILIYRSVSFPSILGGFLMGSGLGYLMESFGNFSFPGNEIWLALVVGISAALGELMLTFYLIFKGIKIGK
ncbi:DUF4386 domain-containing protein [Mangrovivirga cuniculi]|uniref:DUF4386 domain-containing protein n=1 Tax=Mangrovivirga cuniculi TaxID=2715131 RepID=A0A4D7JHW0_9BACT|nr:DUF4386 domain-containing protein [Mangrovivirga cuniculi]QCK15599.1 DUF4386 domain-containing protein [Mangrovivirga cuniculi]